MDAASLPQRATRRCARPGCADVAVATLSFRYDLSQAWVLPLTEEPSPATYDLCGPCADRTKPPRGWHLVDERPDLDAASAAPEEHDVVRAAIAAALRGQGAGARLEAVPDMSGDVANPAPTSAAGESTDPSSTTLRAVPDRPAPRPTPAPTPLADRLGQVPLTPPRIPSPVLAVRDRPEATVRRRPVEVLIQHFDEPTSTPVAEAEVPSAAATTVAGEDDLAAALREHQFEATAAAAVDTEVDAAAPAPEPSAGPKAFPDGSFDMHPVQAAAMQLLVGEGRPEPTLRPPTATPDAGSAQAVAMPFAFDDAPDRFVSLGLDDLGDFTDEDLVAGLGPEHDDDTA